MSEVPNPSDCPFCGHPWNDHVAEHPPWKDVLCQADDCDCDGECEGWPEQGGEFFT